MKTTHSKILPGAFLIVELAAISPVSDQSKTPAERTLRTHFWPRQEGVSFCLEEVNHHTATWSYWVGGVDCAGRARAQNEQVVEREQAVSSQTQRQVKHQISLPLFLVAKGETNLTPNRQIPSNGGKGGTLYAQAGVACPVSQHQHIKASRQPSPALQS